MLRAFYKLNRHVKTALFVAPILIILGWAASDIWMESQAMKSRIFELQVENGMCDVMAKECVLTSADFKINVYEDKGLTTINSTFPLDTATLFLVDQQDNATTYRMGMKDSAYYWYQTTELASLLAKPGSTQKLRLIVTVKGGQYFVEFYSKTGY
ncbi:MAG TPA: hypothetical protein DE179_14135 [Oceanospirillaceae bacterium]|nr:hypothetical protein [Oceanospirillaceae bacterium]